MSWRKASVVASWLAGLAGIGLFLWLFLRTDVLADLAALPAAMWAAVPLAAGPAGLAALSFAHSIPRVEPAPRLPFGVLFRIRLAGEAVNNGLASAYVAGEPVKGLLVTRHGVAPRAGLASALIGKTTLTAGEILFLLVGVGVGAVLFGGGAPVVSLLLAVTGGGLAVVVLAIVVQQRRLLGRGVRLLRAVRLGPRRIWDRTLPGADAIDEAVRGYYRAQRRDFVAATLWAAGGWLLGAFELWLFLVLTTDLAHPAAHAVALEAGIAVVKGLSFFIPASVGAQEGGIVWLFAAAGLGTPSGLAYAVFRRFRELVWIGLGFLCLWWHLRSAAAPVTRKAPVAGAANSGERQP